MVTLGFAAVCSASPASGAPAGHGHPTRRRLRRDHRSAGSTNAAGTPKIKVRFDQQIAAPVAAKFVARLAADPAVLARRTSGRTLLVPRKGDRDAHGEAEQGVHVSPHDDVQGVAQAARHPEGPGPLQRQPDLQDEEQQPEEGAGPVVTGRST
jgi:hypothetical protein